MSSNILWGLLVLITAISSAVFYQRIAGEEFFHKGKTANLDGMRGFLCVIMFICHAESWRQFLDEGVWRTASNPLYILPGQTGIIIFFMITGYLFASKFLQKSSINWKSLFISRLFRLYPAYILMYCALILIVLANTDKESISSCNLKQFLDWFLFTATGNSNICNFKYTNLVVAGVTWSVAFEWAFYFSMPILASILGVKPNLRWIIFSALFTIVTVNTLPKYYLVYYMMLAGVITACIEHRFKLPNFFTNKYFATVGILLLFINFILNSETSYTASSVFFIALFFILLAAGNNFYGTLTSRPLQIFGLATYGIYLYHGIILYGTLITLKPIWLDFHKNEFYFWLSIIAITPVIIFASLLSYIYIEYPSLKIAKRITTIN